MKHMLVAAALACTAAGAAADSYREAVAPAEAREVVAFWEGAGPARWFAKDDVFDRRFRERFLPLHEAAARGDFDGWNATPAGALALMVLLDQFPRNAFRGTPRMYATDAAARRLADAAIAAGHDPLVAVGVARIFLSAVRALRELGRPGARRRALRAASAGAIYGKRSITATSCDGSAASRTATRSSAGR